MQVALLFGDRGSQVKQSIESQADNITIKTYERLGTFMNYVKQSNTSFDRLLITTRFTDIEGLESLQVLKDFIYEYLPRASVVFIVDERDTTGIQTTFNTIFDLAIYTDATTKVSNLGFIFDCINLKIGELRELYSVYKQETVMTISESYGETDESEDGTTQVDLPLTPSYREPMQNTQNKVHNKRTLKEKRQVFMQQAELQTQLDSVLQQQYYMQIQKGYLHYDRYTFDLADVDPNVMLFKERTRTEEKRPIHTNPDRTSELPEGIQKPIKRGYARLAEVYKETGKLTIGVFFKEKYTQEVIVTTQPELMQRFTPHQQYQQQVQQYQQEEPRQEPQQQTPKKRFGLFK